MLAASLVLADLAVIADDEPSSARLAVVRLPASATASPEFLSTLLDGLEPPEAPPAPPPPTADPETGEVPEPTPPTPAAAPRLRSANLTDAVLIDRYEPRSMTRGGRLEHSSARKA